MRATPLLLLIILAAATTPARSQGPAQGPPPAELERIARRFVEAQRARQREGAGAAQVDSALAFLTDSAVYEHPRVGARIVGRDVMRQGMLRFAGTVRGDRTRIVRLTTAPGAVVLELRQELQLRDGEQWVTVRRHAVQVLEFDGARIRRIIDYW
ncbi:MAG TPA: nuclear transport factor 2 family protein [Gemmatimonadaceae bacterium]|nr:nuclear transport factor 2 family protein [Gemmatimonadaceae bacterium]